MASVKRIWNDQELTIAYYIAKWDVAGLKISEKDLVQYVIGETTHTSLKMQVANFRYLLGVEGPQLQDASQSMKRLVDDLANKTMTQVRNTIFAYMEEIEASIEQLKIKGVNAQINKRRDEANAQLNKNFEAQLAIKSQYRRLKRIEK